MPRLQNRVYPRRIPWRRGRRYNIGIWGTPSGMLRMPAPSEREPSGSEDGHPASLTEGGGRTQRGRRELSSYNFSCRVSFFRRRWCGGVDAATISMVRWLGKSVAICDRLWQIIVAATLSDQQSVARIRLVQVLRCAQNYTVMIRCHPEQSIGPVYFVPSQQCIMIPLSSYNDSDGIIFVDKAVQL